MKSSLEALRECDCPVIRLAYRKLVKNMEWQTVCARARGRMWAREEGGAKGKETGNSGRNRPATEYTPLEGYPLISWFWPMLFKSVLLTAQAVDSTLM